jgi:hypothetical protein
VLGLLLVIALGGSAQPVNTVDFFEVNHKLDASTGDVMFAQVIFWQWSADYQRYDAVGYAVIHDRDRSDRWPVRTAGGSYEWRHAGARYRAQRCVESWTVYDPEQLNMRLFPVFARDLVWPAVRCQR